MNPTPITIKDKTIEEVPQGYVSEELEGNFEPSANDPHASDDSIDLDTAIEEVLSGFQKSHESFNQDISHDLPEEVLTRIAHYLEQRVDEDAKHQEQWLNSINLIKPYLGFSLSQIFKKGTDSGLLNNLTTSGVYDNTFATALLRLWAVIRAEILPQSGPVGFKTILDETEASEILGSVVKDALNEYLTTEDKGFYPDFERFLLYLLLYGCVFRKVFIHPISKKPVSRFILPEDFLIENNCSSSFESNRQTHIRYLSRSEIIANLKNGTFRANARLNYLSNNNIISDDSDISGKGYSFDSGVTNSSNQKELSTYDSFKFYETYEYLSINDFLNPSDVYNFDVLEQSEPVPYIITRCATTNKIVSLIPNWNKDDETKKKINHFIHYNLFPGFDIYGLGLGQILGSNAVTLTEIQRISIDSAIFQIFPGGIRAAGIKVQDNNLTIKPGEFVALDTGSLPLQQAIMPLPYQGPSAALLELAERIKNSSAQLASTTEIGISENSANTPVGTTIASLEIANRMQSAVLKTIHNSFSDEIELLFQSFYTKDEIKKFSGFKVIPIADPSVESTTMRIMKAESLLKIAQSAPQIHNMPAIYKRLYGALGVENIDEILLKPQESQSEEPHIDPTHAIQMADTEQRRLEVESRERIAMLQMEAEGYKTQMDIELDKQKLETDRYIADLKAHESELNNSLKMEIELLKISENKAQADKELELKLLKEEKDERIKALETIISELKLEIENQKLKSEPYNDLTIKQEDILNEQI